MSSMLVVDDEKSIRESLTLAFRDKGFQIDTAEDGIEALSHLYAKHYDVVLSDIRMPRMDGVKLLDAIREQWGPSLPVIFISAYVSKELSFLVKKAGAFDVLTKPFSLSEIMKTVDHALEEKPLALSEPKINQDSVTNEIQKKLLEWSALDSIQKSLRPLSAQAALFSTLLNQIQEVYEPDYCVVALYDTDGHEQVLARLPREQDQMFQLLDTRLLSSVSRSHHRPLVIDHIEAHPSFGKHYQLHQGSILAMPFATDCSLHGAVLLYRQKSRQPFTSESIRFLSVLLNFVGVKIENNESSRKLNSYYTDTVQSLFAILEAKDAYTYAHSAKVACYALLVARQLGLPEREFHNLEYLALLQDIGKVALPDYLLHKREPLSEEEYEVWKTHPAVGAAILEPIKFIPGGDLVIRHHHEHYDGSGYPDGLKGKAIPLYARVIAIADGFANLTEQHEFQNHQAQKNMIETMMYQAGKKYDPDMLKLFLKSYCHLILLDKRSSPASQN